MQSIMNISTTFGLPLCLSGVTRHHQLSLSREIADHDRRREATKRVISERRSRLTADAIGGEVSGDDDDDDDDQSSLCINRCPAKAA
uniref:Uncharacterized protein n=1 Tax=Lactuca sativa TaxID=4236 RepID=A0A9R1VVE2_LACSA|nr:hypothetical protein LSAT_V11C400217100 [Lactuca sativa]